MLVVFLGSLGTLGWCHFQAWVFAIVLAAIVPAIVLLILQSLRVQKVFGDFLRNFSVWGAFEIGSSSLRVHERAVDRRLASSVHLIVIACGTEPSRSND